MKYIWTECMKYSWEKIKLPVRNCRMTSTINSISNRKRQRIGFIYRTWSDHSLRSASSHQSSDRSSATAPHPQAADHLNGVVRGAPIRIRRQVEISTGLRISNSRSPYFTRPISPTTSSSTTTSRASPPLMTEKRLSLSILACRPD